MINYVTNILSVTGASVAKWLAHLPFTSKVAGSSLNEFLNVIRTQSSCEMSKKSTLCRKSWVSSWFSGFLPQGKLIGWVRGQIINEVWTNSGCLIKAPCVSSVYLGLLHASSSCNYNAHLIIYIYKSPNRNIKY
jgi:hypothetical protein